MDKDAKPSIVIEKIIDKSDVIRKKLEMKQAIKELKDIKIEG